MHIPFFRIFYSTTFTILTLLLTGLLLVTPSEQVWRSFRNKQIFNIFFIIGSHLLTLAVAIFIYAGRLFANRKALAAIPKSWSPIEKGDVEKPVRRIVNEHLKRSVLIAFEAHPRNLQDDATPTARGAAHGEIPASDAAQLNVQDDLTDDSPLPIWGKISHPGWSSPSSPDLPNLHYTPVIIELPHLIEAKAVSLAPHDPSLPTPPSSSGPSLSIHEPSLPDTLAVELLQRPATMGLRDYITHLSSLDMIHPPELGDEFLNLYEKARFSGSPLAESDFRRLMHVFAEILRGMTVLGRDIVAALHEEEDERYYNNSPISDNEDEDDDDEDDDDEDDDDEDDDRGSSSTSGNSTQTVEYTPRPPSVSPYHFMNNSSSGSTSSSGSRGVSPLTARTSHFTHHRPRASPGMRSLSRGTGFRSYSSMASVRSHATSLISSGGGSVIRLADAREALDLPYVIEQV